MECGRPPRFLRVRLAGGWWCIVREEVEVPVVAAHRVPWWVFVRRLTGEGEAEFAGMMTSRFFNGFCRPHARKKNPSRSGPLHRCCIDLTNIEQEGCATARQLFGASGFLA